MSKNIIAVAMSGGIDSSVVAYMLLAQKENIFGITMYLHEHSVKAIEDAEKVSKHLGIEHFVFDLRNVFAEKVINIFKQYYENGLTPNPCALCNRDIKMGIFLQKAIEKGATLMATGHYARNDSETPLMEAVDKIKDQSYFLSLIPKDYLKKTIFPLGNIISKQKTRENAKKFGIHNFSAKESQDICFIPDNNYKKFLKSLSLIQNPGEIIHIETRKILGEHTGIFNYTIGQRRGLNISNNIPLYVISIDVQKNIIYVGNKNLLHKNVFEISSLNWLISPVNELYASVKIRSTCKKLNAKIENLNNSIAKITLLERNDTSLSAGQICAIYQNDTILGGGIIRRNSVVN